MGNRTTIQDIADEAGVSKATVSYILNHKPGKSISPATRVAVLAAAKKLGAAETVNASQGDTVALVKALTQEGRGCDIAIEATGYPEVWEKNICMARKGGKVLLFGGTKAGTQLVADANLVHYSQLTIMGLYHTTPVYTMTAFELLKNSIIKAEDFISESYPLEKIETAILEHSKGMCIKNKILLDA